jgi:cyclic beta-1,2-glucan synthetase
VRLTISHKRLLQWTTAAHTVRLFGRHRRLAIAWRRMGGATLVALGIAALTGLIAPEQLPVAGPLLLGWLVSPLVAHWISRTGTKQQTALSVDQYRRLRGLARRTWLYFERFVGPDDHWLPPDHFQEQPRGLTAHRTSPTNIGLFLLSTLSAYELGYIGPMDLALRLGAAFEGMDALERYRGHFLNWYVHRR